LIKSFKALYFSDWKYW